MDTDSTNTGNDQSKYTLDIFGQNPRLSRLYTQLCFCFDLPRSDVEFQHQAVEILNDGLQRLCHDFSWISGQVVCDSNGVYCIEPHANPLRVVSQDGRLVLPRMSAYSESGFPFSMLDESTVAACKTLPGESSGPAAVLLIKATFIEGGLLLNFDGQHNCMDIAGQCEIIRLFSKACRGEPFTADEIHTGNLPRCDIIPVNETPKTNPETPSALSTQPPPEIPPCPIPASTNGVSWSYFLFPGPSLNSLKSLATRTLPKGESPQEVPFISTDDALSALIWQSVTRARIPDLAPNNNSDESLDVLSTFDRQVDARKALKIPAAYTGNVVHKTSLRMSCRQILELELGELAAMMRREVLDPERIARLTRESAGKLRESLKGRNSGGGGGARKTELSAVDFRMSSWAKEGCYGFDFGGKLGKPAAVRRPGFPAWEGLGYFMPKTGDGEVAVGLCLREEAMERLKGDEGFCRYGRYVG